MISKGIKYWNQLMDTLSSEAIDQRIDEHKNKFKIQTHF